MMWREYGLLGVYELNRVDLLRDVFVWAYERSAVRYAVVRQQLGEPDPFRLRYGTKICELIASLVTRGLDQRAATEATKRFITKHIPTSDQSQFAEVTKAEVLALHEGNIARYRIRPAEFARWRARWSTM
jgi:hypothetical protein